MDGLQMKYFVLKPGGRGVHAAASRMAMRAYSRAVHGVNPALATELLTWADNESEAAMAADEGGK